MARSPRNSHPTTGPQEEESRAPLSLQRQTTTKHQRRGGVISKAESHPIVSGEIVMAQATFYVLSEEKLDNLTDQNDDARDYKASAAGLLSFAIGLFSNYAFTGKLTALGTAATFIVAPLCLLAACILFFMGRRHQNNAGGILTKIKKNALRSNLRFDITQEEASNSRE